MDSNQDATPLPMLPGAATTSIEAPSLEPRANPEAELCRNCGLCCNGVWHDHGPLKPGETARARAAGLQVFAGGSSPGEAVFSQPCSQHAPGLGCRGYGTWRPAVCVAYQCAVLRQLNSGVLNYQEASSILGTARNAWAELSRALGDAGTPRDTWTRVNEWAKAAVPEEPRARQRHLLIGLYWKSFTQLRKRIVLRERCD